MSRITLIALVGLFACGTALAAETPVVDKREANQERRIEQGKASGELTNREAARLEHANDRLKANEEKAKADGVVTAGERARLRTEARRDSKRIARQKHDAQDKH
ncbi:MAG: hypothetical protein U1F18_12710 [Steroidobacteraceae bacterium]|jgi:hypothetical protein